MIVQKVSYLNGRWNILYRTAKASQAWQPLLKRIPFFDSSTLASSCLALHDIGLQLLDLLRTQLLPQDGEQGLTLGLGMSKIN